MEIQGRVCEDLNEDGRCQDGEPGIEGITIWSDDGRSVASSDERGRFALRVRSADEYLRVLVPNSYRGAGKVLARPNTEVAMARLAERTAAALALGNLAGLAPLYALISALIGAVVIGNLRLGSALGALRRQQRQSAQWSQQADVYRHRSMVEEQLNRLGPAGLAAQLVSDALGESLNAELFVVGLAPTPAPHLIFEGGGRRFVLTVNPGALRRARLVGRWAAQAPLADGGALANLEAQALWERMVAQATLVERPVTPRSAEWYVVIDRVGSRTR